MRLIDADAFDKCLENAEAEAIHMRKHVFASAVNVIRGNLRSFPTIEERKKGRIVNPTPYGECAECGCLIDSREGYNFCPNCGADLRGEREETD